MDGLFGTSAITDEMQSLFDEQQDIVAKSAVVDDTDEVVVDNSPEAVRERILQSCALGMSLQDACIAEGVDDWADKFKDDEDFQKDLRYVKAQLEAQYLRNLMAAATKAATNGNTRPVSELLAALNPERYGKDAQEKKSAENKTKGLKIQFVTKDRPLPVNGDTLFDEAPATEEPKPEVKSAQLNLDI